MATETAAEKKARLAKEEAAQNPNAEKQKQEQLAALGQDLLNIQANVSGGPKSGTSTSTAVTKLTYESAKALMQKAAEDADFIGKFSKADIEEFMKEFDIKQNSMIAKTVTSTASKTTALGTADGASRTVESTAKQEFPSFFKPEEFAADFIWKKINFKDEATLGAKSLDALAKVRGIVQSFQLLGVSDAEAKVAAKQIAMGKKTEAEYTVELQKLAKKEYPQFADRFDTDPTLTTYDIASPIIDMLAKTWQVDKKTIKMDNPLVTKWLRYAGPDGKGVQPSYNDLLIQAKNDPKYELTTEANENARDAASSLARAMGFGV